MTGLIYCLVNDVRARIWGLRIACPRKSEPKSVLQVIVPKLLGIPSLPAALTGVREAVFTASDAM